MIRFSCCPLFCLLAHHSQLSGRGGAYVRLRSRQCVIQSETTRMNEAHGFESMACYLSFALVGRPLGEEVVEQQQMWKIWTMIRPAQSTSLAIKRRIYRSNHRQSGRSMGHSGAAPYTRIEMASESYPHATVCHVPRAEHGRTE